MSLDEGISVPEAVDRGSLALAFGVDVAVGKVSAHKEPWRSESGQSLI